MPPEPHRLYVIWHTNTKTQPWLDMLESVDPAAEFIISARVAHDSKQRQSFVYMRPSNAQAIGTMANLVYWREAEPYELAAAERQ